jgi:hypothetical protein
MLAFFDWLPAVEAPGSVQPEQIAQPRDDRFHLTAPGKRRSICGQRQVETQIVMRGELSSASVPQTDFAELRFADFRLMSLILLVPLPRLERGTPRSTIWCSNQLSYSGARTKRSKQRFEINFKGAEADASSCCVSQLPAHGAAILRWDTSVVSRKCLPHSRRALKGICET